MKLPLSKNVLEGFDPTHCQCAAHPDIQSSFTHSFRLYIFEFCICALCTFFSSRITRRTYATIKCLDIQMCWRWLSFGSFCYMYFSGRFSVFIAAVIVTVHHHESFSVSSFDLVFVSRYGVGYHASTKAMLILI